MTQRDYEQRPLHKLLLATNIPAAWPAGVVGGVLLLLIALVGGLWWLLANNRAALLLISAHIVFCLADTAILASLPRRRISFGPVGAQLVWLTLPRLLVTAFAALVATRVGPAAAGIGAVLLNLGASLALAWSALVEPAQVQVNRLTLTSKRLPRDAPPVRLLQVSDLHVARFGQREGQVLQWVQELAPDIIALTGDYVNLSCVDDPVAQAAARRVLAGLAAPAGVFAVPGSPPVDRNAAALFEGLPIRLLHDEAVTVDLGQGRRLTLLGLTCSHFPQRDAQRLTTVAAQAPPGTFRLLLYHSPDLIPLGPQCGIDLYLCGHTHGGQVRLPLFGAMITASKMGKRFEMGHYQIDNTHIYINRGVGLEGMGTPRVRFLCRPEVTLFKLQGLSQGRTELPACSEPWAEPLGSARDKLGRSRRRAEGSAEVEEREINRPSTAPPAGPPLRPRKVQLPDLEQPCQPAGH